MKRNFLLSLVAAVLSVSFISCEDELPARITLNLPQADFTYTTHELTVVFTDKSQNVVSYFWNLGDGTTSTEQNPTHTYAKGGTYAVELTVTGEKGKTSSKKENIKFDGGEEPEPIDEVNITVDGNFADWADVPETMLAVATLDAAKTELVALKELKMCANDVFIYLYVKMDNANANAMDLYLNIDGDEENGYNGWMWDKLNADYMMQGFYADKYDMRLAQYDESKGGGWGWLTPDIVAPGSGLMTISDIKTVEGTIVEFEGRIVREMIPNLKKDVRVSMGHSGKPGGAWDTSGGLPTVPSTGDKNRGLLVKLP